MYGVIAFMLFAAATMVGLGIIVWSMVDRWDAILAALAGEPIPERRHPIVARRVARMRPAQRRFSPAPTRQQIRRAAA